MLDIPPLAVLIGFVLGGLVTVVLVELANYRRQQDEAQHTEQLVSKFAELDTQRGDGQLNGWFDALDRSDQDTVVDHMSAERGKMRDERWKARQEEAKKQRDMLGV